ncbi:MAG TPA: glycoside hydrolase family 57 protein [Gammaproteobacteria bacterium]|nr:glycoside hydrolase family 57 protein [Gammaproteobacteria bacterium]
MCADTTLNVVLCWHMHQPEYRDLRTGEYQLPWTYLHVIKDYVDMAAHLESVPDARAVVNFAPVLLEQIDDYAQQVAGFLRNGAAIRDPLLAALVEPALPGPGEGRMKLIKDCLRANEERLIARFEPYQRLATIAHWLGANPEALLYVDEQFVVDLVVWHHLAWVGETVRRSDTRIKRLTDKATGYTLHDRRELLTVIGELLEGVIGRYRALAESGRVELSVTPYAHPIVPLLLDLQSAHEAMPEAPLPELPAYPGGEERARWHIRQGIDTFRRYFGFAPQGCWPSEGSVSTATLKLLAEYDFRWAASGGSVLHNSLNRAGQPADSQCLHRGYGIADSGLDCFFRDDGLSDLIGFTYSDWHADDAVANLIHHLETIAKNCRKQPGSVVPIILDGENAWEHYPENGYYFLRALYQRLAEHPQINLTTFSRCLDEGAARGELAEVVAGSWVYGTFSTWIGDRDKNRGWDMLGEAKQTFDRVAASGRLDAEHLARAVQQLAICEGSDWFWWFGDYNPAETVSDFERLYRRHLANLYQVLGEEPPAYLSQSFTHGGGAPLHGGAMRPGQAAG